MGEIIVLRHKMKKQYNWLDVVGKDHFTPDMCHPFLQPSHHTQLHMMWTSHSPHFQHYIKSLSSSLGLTQHYLGTINQNEWINEWVSEWVSEWVTERLTEWINEWMNYWLTDWMNECNLSDAVTENCCRGTVQKLSSKMALSVSEEMMQWTGEQRNIQTTHINNWYLAETRTHNFWSRVRHSTTTPLHDGDILFYKLILY